LLNDISLDNQSLANQIQNMKKQKPDVKIDTIIKIKKERF